MKVPRVNRRTFLKTTAVATAGAFAATLPRPARAQSNPWIVDVSNVPVPDFTGTNRHAGVETVLRTLACAGIPFYQAPSRYPWSDPGAGLIAADDVVVVKVNGQWQYRGITNSDVLRGLIQRILDHPQGFRGEVVLFENGQGRGSLDAQGSRGSYPPTTVPRANAEDEAHSFRFLVDQVFQDPRVSAFLMDTYRSVQVPPDDHATTGYRRDGLVSYPCFPTGQGTRIEWKEGVWDGTAYRPNLKILNVPVFKTHGGSAVTGALKHMYGVLSMQWDQSYHYSRIGEATGDMHSVIRTPALNLIDCIWVSPGALAGYPAGNTVRTNRLLAGFDPVALDYYAGKHVLLPAGGNSYHDPDTSPDFRALLVGARDRINANGGLPSGPVTFDETEFLVMAADASAPPAEPGELRVRRDLSGVRLEWQGGTPPFRVWRSEWPDSAMQNPVLLTDCCGEFFYVDPGVLADGRTYFYRVEAGL